MHFISTFREQNVILKHKRRVVVDTANMGKIASVIDGIRVRFKPLSSPFETKLLATRGKSGKAYGILDSKESVRENWKPTLEVTKDELEREIIQGLMMHPLYGVHFVGLDGDGDLVEEEETFFNYHDDGTVYCTICDKQVATTQGLNGHRRSKAHKENLEAAREVASQEMVAV